MNSKNVKLNFFLDEGVPDSVAGALRDSGHEATVLRESGVARGSPDPVVCAFAEVSNSILVALDGDMKKLAQDNGVGAGRFKLLNLLKLSCSEPSAAERVRKAMSLIEHEWIVGKQEGQRLFVDMGTPPGRVTPMSEAQESATLSEVADFLRRRRQDYISLLAIVSRELRRFKDRPDLQSVIYRIYSREDKQIGGDPLKADSKIAKKLSEKRRDEGPSSSIPSIHDIIGVTVVTYFTSQIDMVVNGLITENALGNLIVRGSPEPKGNGYHATHLVLESSSRGLAGLLCEVQVKSVLHDGWATKTHDLIYKPRTRIKSEHSTQMKILSDSIALIELQSDIIRKVIEDEWAGDRARRAAAQHELLAKLTEEHEHADQVSQLANLIREKPSNKSDDHPSETLSNHFNFWRETVKTGRHNEFSCRFITLLASVLEASDLNNLALDAIDAWIGSEADGEKKMRALYCRALANYTFGRFSDAVRYQEIMLDYASKNGLQVQQRKNTLAYFIAEDFYHNPGRDAEDKFERAKKLLSEAESFYTGDQRAIFIDTQGAVMIAFCDTDAEIRGGLRLCQEALEFVAEGTAERGLAEAYYRLHEKRACRRLLERE